MADKLATQPPKTTYYELSYPAPYVMLVTINREAAMNAIPMAGHWDGMRLWAWFDEEPGLRVAVVTGKGKKAFCCGADLKEQFEKKSSSAEAPQVTPFPPGSFMGLSTRVGKKPVIAAVNGFALGEAKRGLWAAAGGIPRVVRTFGMQKASEIVLAGRTLTAEEAKDLGFCRVSASPDSLLDEAVTLAKEVADMSPDAVVVSRAGLRETWETASVDRSAQLVSDRYAKGILEGENLRIGLTAFVTKSKPEWVPSKL
ncbi:hypothetical protein PLIIFM63780_000300 [Purpureocillium lilacinum]|nr:hypothetical protein PLIIFM63780_000300 [Purpureocillium lilacinum]